MPGIGPSPDKMLQARLMSYADAHRYRVGNNYQQLPVNRPRCPVHHDQRDGYMSFGQGCNEPNYFPNRYADTPKDDPATRELAWHLGDVTVDRYNSREGHDDYTQAGNLYRLFDDGQRDRLTRAIAAGFGQARREVQVHQLQHFDRANEEHGRRVAAALGFDMETLAAERVYAIPARSTYKPEEMTRSRDPGRTGFIVADCSNLLDHKAGILSRGPAFFCIR